MVEDIKGLIAKIQQEGIKAAEDKAQDIENEAKKQAQAIVAEASKEAQKLIAQAKGEIARMEQSSKASLEQSGRDLLLALREQIYAMLQGLILAHVRQALRPEEMSGIITEFVKQQSKKHQGEIIVSLKEQDLKKIEKGLLGKLRTITEKGITLRPSREISGGFIISYDSGKSHYDFTDQGIAEYLSTYLKPKLGQILKAATNPKLKTLNSKQT